MGRKQPELATVAVDGGRPGSETQSRSARSQRSRRKAALNPTIGLELSSRQFVLARLAAGAAPVSRRVNYLLPDIVSISAGARSTGGRTIKRGQAALAA